MDDPEPIFQALERELARGELQARVATPAAGLRLLAGLTMAVLLLGLAYDGLLFVSGAVEEPAATELMSRRRHIEMRVGWNLAMLLTNALIWVGAGRLGKLYDEGFARLACGLALVPILGPCFLAGIPFAIWALIAMRGKEMQAAFEEGNRRRAEGILK